MGIQNYLIEGLSGTGKTAVCDELLRRGHQAIHGDRELAYQGDPETGEPRDGFAHDHHLWNVDKVRERVADRSRAATFFCGGSRNLARFVDLFDDVFVLETDWNTLDRRLARRPHDEWGGRAEHRALVRRLHAAGEGCPTGATAIDTVGSVSDVVDAILERTNRHGPSPVRCTDPASRP